MRTAREAYQYLNQIRQIVMYLGICDGNLEEGSLRCDANISVRKKGATEFGTKIEIKNLNSFRNVEKAIEYEIKRQVEAIEQGEILTQETRMWDAGTHQTKSMRSKEFAHDYRYFPEPDLAGVNVTDAMIENIGNTMPELPLARKKRFVNEYGLPWYDAGILTESQHLGTYFEECCQSLTQQTKDRYKLVSNWIMTEVLRYLSDKGVGIEQFPVTSSYIAELVELFAAELISSKIAKDIFPEVIAGESPKSVVERKGLLQISDESIILAVVEKILAEQTDNVTKYHEGKKNLFGHFVSSTLKELGGKANPRIVTKLLQERLQEVK
jgi:aspartyl-tRNA(Asn)/glutamyl-tRNA(Gln) amidotransferase subunit B